MTKRKRGIGFTILMMLPSAPPAVPAFDLAEELYPDDPGGLFKIRAMIVQLKKLGWKIQHHNGSYYTLDKNQHGLIKKYCRITGSIFRKKM